MSIPVCDQCHLAHTTHHGTQACKAHVARDGGRPCRKAPLNGLTICPSHGANRAAKTKAAQRLAEQAATKVMRRFGSPIDTTATEALLDTVKWTAGYVAWLRDKVAATDTDDDLIWGKTKTTEQDISVPGVGVEKAYGTVDEAKPSMWLVLLAEWSDRLVKVCAETIRAGVEERRVRLAEQQGALVADVITRILSDLTLTPEQTARVGEVVPRHLRLLTS